LLSRQPFVASVTQLGLRLRVLIPDSTPDPLSLIQKTLHDRQISARTAEVSASLEDVFVAVTLKAPPQQAAA
jgi:ABC-2 type transport system ATP-binding protein